MIRFLIVLIFAVLALLALGLLSGCSTLASYGIGGPPRLMCSTDGQALLDDRVVGPDAARLSLVRRFADGDKLCRP